MNVRTNLHAGQNGTVDMNKIAELVQELDCQIPPMELLGLAQKYCKNITADKVAAIMQAAGVSGGPAGLLSLFGG
jgi:hypothetical protein